jgi:hypothetical protein
MFFKFTFYPILIVNSIIDIYTEVDKEIESLDFKAIYEPIGLRQDQIELFVAPTSMTYSAAIAHCAESRSSLFTVHPQDDIKSIFKRFSAKNIWLDIFVKGSSSTAMGFDGYGLVEKTKDYVVINMNNLAVADISSTKKVFLKLDEENFSYETALTTEEKSVICYKPLTFPKGAKDLKEMELFKTKIKRRIEKQKQWAENLDDELENIKAFLPVFPNKTGEVSYVATKDYYRGNKIVLDEIKKEFLELVKHLGLMDHYADLPIWYMEFDNIIDRINAHYIQIRDFFEKPQFFVDKVHTENLSNIESRTVTIFKINELFSTGHHIVKIGSDLEIPCYLNQWTNLLNVVNFDYWKKLTLIDFVLIGTTIFGLFLAIGSYGFQLYLRRKLSVLERKINQSVPVYRVNQIQANQSVERPRIKETIIKHCPVCHTRAIRAAKGLPSNLPTNMRYNELTKARYMDPRDLPALYMDSD